MQDETRIRGRSSSSASSTTTSHTELSNPCPICLGAIKDEAFLDRCFHAFCYGCIVHWTKIVARKQSQSLSSIKCPLCKTENLSIVHGLSGGFFKQHYINPDHNQSSFSEDQDFRWHCYENDSGMLGHKLNVPTFWKCHHYLKKNKWLERWLRRELQTLVQEIDVDIIVHHILGVVDSFLERQKMQNNVVSPEQKREEFKSLLLDAAKPFVLGRVERFVTEIELFLVSGLNIEAYDRVCMQCLAMTSFDANSQNIEEPENCFPVLDFVDGE